MERTRKAAASDARLVVWNEASTVLLPDEEEQWIGESIVMFPTVCMYAGDPNTPCIRVRFDDELSEGSDF